MNNFKILEIFKSQPFYSKCNVNINLTTYDSSVIGFTDSILSRGNFKFNNSSPMIASYLYVYIAFTAISVSTSCLDFLRMVSLPIRLPIFNILLMKNVSGNVRLYSKSTGNVFGECITHGTNEFVNHCLSLTESDLNSICKSKLFGSILSSNSEKQKFLHNLKLIINNCFDLDDSSNVVNIKFSNIMNALEFASRSIDNWECDEFHPDVGDYFHLNIHRFRGHSGHYVCDYSGFSSLSSDKITLFVCFLSLFDVSFTSSSDGINFSRNITSCLPGDSSFYAQDVHHLLAWTSVFGFARAIPLKDSSSNKNAFKSNSSSKVKDEYSSESLLHSTSKQGTKVKSPLNISKQSFSTHNGFTPVEYVYVNKYFMVPYISDCGSRILFGDPEWLPNRSKCLFKVFQRQVI